MTDEPQVALTDPPITHVWATTYESEFERKQRKVFCLRAEQGLAITECGHEHRNEEMIALREHLMKETA